MNKLPADLMASVRRHLSNRDTKPRPALPEGRGTLKVTAFDGVAEVLLFDEIGWYGIRAEDVIHQLADVTATTINLRINSPGGDVFDGVAIMNALADHPATVNVTVDGLAASAASFIAMAGDTITMNRGAQMMVHDASGLCIGNASDMAEMVDLLDRISNTIAALYAERAGGTVEDWRATMRAETWYSAPEAVTAGLADQAVGPASEGMAAASIAASFDLTCFLYAGRGHAPAPALNRAGPAPEADPVQPAPTTSEIETAPAFDAAAFRDAMRGAFA